ncbi:dethiobiotin synthase [Nitrincola sp. MINF-07-Sa-05]|uniref:dethiobiotin synthase n=1 Tax=Nitrincola salilacus TaxID=3400273 RepID=UPI0039181211
MKHIWFVAGTDTEVGKTVVSAALLTAANRLGLQTIGLKPLAAGCEETPDGLRNDDALQLQQAASVRLSYDQVNPIALQAAVAPHIAAGEQRLSAERIVAYCRGALMQRADLVVIEGAGGWRVPLNARETLARVPQLMEIPVVLVVGMKLGCINHALLTAEAIARDGLQLAGWVANQVDPNMVCFEENLQSLKDRLRAPLLGTIPWLDQPACDRVADYLDLSRVIEVDRS